LLQRFTKEFARKAPPFFFSSFFLKTIAMKRGLEEEDGDGGPAGPAGAAAASSSSSSAKRGREAGSRLGPTGGYGSDSDSGEAAAIRPADATELARFATGDDHLERVLAAQREKVLANRGGAQRGSKRGADGDVVDKGFVGVKGFFFLFFIFFSHSNAFFLKKYLLQLSDVQQG
jgi:hypothetical protein